MLKRLACPDHIQPVGPIIPASAINASRQADDIIAAAHAEAARIIEAAHQEALSNQANFRNEAVQEQTEHIQATIEELAAWVETTREQITTMASKVCRAALEKMLIPLTVQKRLSVTLANVVPQIVMGVPLKLYVGTGQTAEGSTLLERLAALHKISTLHITIAEDSSLDAADAALETSAGARIECRFQTLFEAIMGSLRET